jgi:VCBS repeat-containing protein
MLTRGKIMKRILLTSTALVAFAGAAAADISLSGDAEFSASTGGTYTSTVSLTAAAEQALDNGYTASVSLTAESVDGAAAGLAAGDISIANDSSSVTFHVAGDGAGAAYLGDVVGGSAGTAGIFEDPDTVGEDADVSASTTIGGATIAASLHGADYEIGVSTDMDGLALAVGYTAAGEFGAMVSGSAGSAAYTIAMDSNSNFGAEVSTTAGGADLTLSAAEGGAYELGASMPLGGATVGITLDDAQAWEVSVDTALDAVALGMTFDSANAWTMEAGYAAGAIGFDFATDSAGAWSIDATYDLGNGITAGLGTTDAAAQYAEVNYDLGGGAALAVEYGAAGMVDGGPDEDIQAGTTMSVGFSF